MFCIYLLCAPAIGYALAGCQSSSPAPGVWESLAGGGAKAMGGERRDLEPAIIAALDDCDLTWLTIHEMEGGGRLYELLDPFDRRGWLRIDVVEQGEERTEYRTACRMGRFGMPEVEALLLERVDHHLQRIRAREKSPVDETIAVPR